MRLRRSTRPTTAAALAVVVVAAVLAPLVAASPATPGTASCGAGGFADVGVGHPFRDDICWMADEGISTGYPDGTYRPSAPVSRQAMSAFLYRLAGSPDFVVPAQATFADVAPTADFFAEVEWMAAEAISTGYAGSPKPTYRPGEPVTRQAMSAFLHRLADGPGVGIHPMPEVPASDAFANRNWQATAYDTCPESLHETYSVIGPDGRRYPTWHPPVVTDPATGQPCTFGHEHGADPRGSDLYDWVAGHLAADGYERWAGIPFGYANEELVAYAEDNPGVPTRFEDHVGHKVSFADDVVLLDDRGRHVPGTDPDTGASLNVTCDYFLKVHQGSHSADATGNNLHELIYAMRCNDGTEVLSTTMAAFGPANEFERSCQPGATVAAGTSHPFEHGGGTRLLPDRGCIEQYVLVSPPTPPLQSDIWALYENWQLEAALTLPDGDPLAWYEPWFAVRNPSRYFRPGQPIGRPLDAAWEPDTGTGTVNAQPWLTPAAEGPYDAYDPRSPFNGAQRDFYLQATTVQNDGGPTRWYTDPMGGNASTEPFPGAICQIVSANDNADQPTLRRRLFGRQIDYGNGNGVHAPN